MLIRHNPPAAFPPTQDFPVRPDLSLFSVAPDSVTAAIENRFVFFTNPDFVRLAESMGCKGYRVRHADELCDILEDAFRQEVPAVIDCPVDYRENTLLTQRLKTIMDEHRT